MVANFQANVAMTQIIQVGIATIGPFSLRLNQEEGLSTSASSFFGYSDTVKSDIHIVVSNRLPS